MSDVYKPRDLNVLEYMPVGCVDDTFNDDTPAQTFDDISSRLAAIKFNPSGKHRGIAPVMRDEGTDEKCAEIVVTVCPKCGSTVPADSVENSALSKWAARFLKAAKGIEVSE